MKEMSKKNSIEQVLKESFELWKSTIKYNTLFSLLYFGLLMVFVNTILVYTGVLEKIVALYPIMFKNPEIFQHRVEALAETEEFSSAVLVIIICKGLIYPLHIGLLKIFRKMENKEEVFINDLFDGYSGINFFKYASYYIAWIMIYNFAMQFVVLGFFWVMATLFIPFLMYFRQEPMGTALLWNFKLLKSNFILLFLCILFALLFSYVGILVFFVGYIFTFPFWCSMIYVLYKYLVERVEIKDEKTEN